MSSAYSNNALGDPATLDANRYGHFAPWQCQQLQQPSLVGSLNLVVLAGAFVEPLCLFFLVQFLRGRFGGSDSLGVFNLIFLGLFFLSLVSLLPLLLGPLSSLLRKMRLRSDLTEGYIAQQDGQVVFVSRTGYV